MRKELTASTAMLTLMWAVPALAQTAPAQDNDSAAAVADNADSGDIIVTAQRRSENLQRVPISVNVVTADILRERNLNDLQQITLAAPSLQIGAENTYSVRGVGTLAFQQTVDPAVAISLDEVNLARNLLSEGLFTDVAQVEVLNGPQGLLFGRNASAGLLNITTVRPQIGELSMDANLEFNYRDSTPGNGKGAIARANVNVPVSANSALRLNVGYQYQQPVVEAVRSGTGSDIDRRSFDFRGKYLLDATDNLEIYLIGNYSQNSGTAGIFDRTYRFLAPGSTNRAPLTADGFVPGPNLLQYKADGANFRNLKIYGAQGRVSYRFDNDWELIELAAYRGYKYGVAFDQDFTTGNAASSSTGSSRFRQFSNELRLALPTDNALSGQVGVYYMTFRDNATNAVAGNLYLPAFLLPNYPFCVQAPVVVPGAFPPTCSVRNDFAIGSDSAYTFKSKSYAGFGQFTYELSPGLRLIAGGRLTRDEIDMDVTQNQFSYFVRFGGPRGRYRQTTGHTDFSYKLGAQYEPTSQIMLYGSYAKGYKGPGANSVSPTAAGNLIVRPETSRNIELGAKTSWLDRRVIFNVSLFQTKYRDYQSAAFDPAQATFVITNAARLTSKGVEIATTLRPFEGLTLNGSATFLDAKFDDFPGRQCYPGQLGCAASGTFNAAGVRLPSSAKFTSSLAATYRTDLSDDVALILNADWYHRSSVNFQPAPNPLTELGAIDVFGARIGLDLDDHVQLSVFCKNCGDERVPTSIYNDPGDAAARPAPLNSTVQTFGFNSVRTWGASVGFRF